MKTKVKVVFPADEPDVPTWPYIGYDVKKRLREVLAILGGRLPELDFAPGIYRSKEQAEQALQSEHFDGYLVYMTAMWTGIAELYARNAHPVIVADELYSARCFVA